jgi:hypothetical protein
MREIWHKKITLNVGLFNRELLLSLLEDLTHNKGRNYNENRATKFKILSEGERKMLLLEMKFI